MGSVISKGANDVGSAIGNAFSAPFKSIFGGSCEEICSGPWDVFCFIEHLCISSLVKLLLILALCYILLIFLYLLYKLGICQCMGRSMCKMYCVACEACWYAFEDATCYLWHKLINTKRVYRGRRRRHRLRDVELGYSSTDDESDGSCNYGTHVGRNKKRKSLRERRNVCSSRSTRRIHHQHGRVEGKRSWRLKSSRQVQFRNQHGKTRKIFKRRRLK